MSDPRRVDDPKERAQVALQIVGLKLGWYRHHKGGDYIVYSTSVNEATLEPMVHYASVAHGYTRWTRSIDNFRDVVLGGPRFTFVRGASREDFLDAMEWGDAGIRRAERDAKKGGM